MEEWRQTGLGYDFPVPFQWSQDGRHLYFNNRPVPDGCAIFVNGSDLLQVDLNTGAVTQLVSDIGLNYLSLSPDEDTLAYITSGEPSLVLRDLSSGEERSTEIEYLPDGSIQIQIGGIVWSPNGNLLLYALLTDPCSPSQATTTLVQVDLNNLASRILLDKEPDRLTPQTWIEPDHILLESFENQTFTLDLNTGAITPEE